MKILDPLKIRQDFPMYRHDSLFEGRPLVYLDNAATTFKPYSVIKEGDRYYEDITANAHRGDYSLAHEVDVAYEGARKEVAGFINADVDEVCFTSGDSMGMNEIAYGLLPFLKPVMRFFLLLPSTLQMSCPGIRWLNLQVPLSSLFLLIKKAE